MGNNDIKVKDLSTTSSLSTDNKLMLLTDEANNTVQNITVENALANIISSNANNSLSVGSDKKLYTRDISGEVGDLDNLITTDKTDIVSAINEVKGDTSAITGEVVSASKGWLEEGKIYQKAYWYGEKIYNDVYSYNHSTFDLSKFTVVGTPTITDDGIASGFGSSQGLKLPTFDFSTMSEFKLNFKFKTPASYTLNNDEIIVGMAGHNTTGFMIRWLNSGRTLRAVPYLSTSAGTSNINSVVLSLNTEYYCQFIFDVVNSKTTLGISTDGINYTNTITTITTNIPTSWIEPSIGFSGSTSLYYEGSIDLKQFSITVDGYPVFSGNKTGIDTIKPDDYTVVGTPTINADGVASGFSGSNYITTIYSGTTKDFEVLIPFTVQTLDATHNILGQMLLLYANGRFVSDIGDGAKYGNVYATVNTSYLAKIKLKNGYHSLNISTDNGANWVEVFNVANTNTYTFNNITIGCYNNYNYFKGSIDLNSFKIYVDGNLVYQPCLLIPYNLSSTGSKIVDVAYRERVIDVYQQFGSANYYTIDEVNQNATLPMGEIYGFIEKTKENFSVPAYGNQNIGVTITDNLTYTCPDDGFIYCDNIQVTAGGGFDLSITRNGQSSSLISFGGISVDASVQIPFIYPVIKGDVVQILWSSTSGTYPILYFVSKEGV